MSKYEAIEKLEEVSELVEQAIDITNEIVRDDDLDAGTRERAFRYWYALLVKIRNNDHEFVGSASVTIEDTIEELRA